MWRGMVLDLRSEIRGYQKYREFCAQKDLSTLRLMAEISTPVIEYMLFMSIGNPKYRAYCIFVKLNSFGNSNFWFASFLLP